MRTLFPPPDVLPLAPLHYHRYMVEQAERLGAEMIKEQARSLVVTLPEAGAVRHGPLDRAESGAPARITGGAGGRIIAFPRSALFRRRMAMDCIAPPPPPPLLPLNLSPPTTSHAG